MSLLEKLVDPKAPTSVPTNGGDKPLDKTRLHHIRDGDLAIMIQPYHASADQNAWQLLPWFWKKLKDEGLIELYFPGAADTSFGDFAAMFTSREIQKILFLLVDPHTLTEEKPTVIDCMGFATWTPMDMAGTQVGNCGFIFFKEYWDRTTTVAACRKGMYHWFHEVPQPLDIAVGLNPSSNRLVQKFLHRLGWTRVGELPIPQYYDGGYSNMAIWYMTKEMFDQQESK